MFDRPADIPVLLDRIQAFHGGKLELKESLSAEQATALEDLFAALATFREAVSLDYRSAEGKAGETFLVILRDYYNTWVA